MASEQHQRLRQETRDQHERLHQVVDLKLMLATKKVYAASLLAYLRAVQTLERAVLELHDRGCPQGLPNADIRLDKTNWLLSDLSALGMSEAALDLANDPRKPDHPCTLATMAGYCYAMEGMTLGATRMLPQIEQSLGLSATNGARFFAAYGPQTLERWHEFRHWISQVPPEEQVLHAARFAFDCFERELTAWNHASRTSQGLPLHA